MKNKSSPINTDYLVKEFIAELQYGKKTLEKTINALNDILSYLNTKDVDLINKIKNLSQYIDSCLQQKLLINKNEICKILDIDDIIKLSNFYNKMGISLNPINLINLTEENFKVINKIQNNFDLTELYIAVGKNIDDFVNIIENNHILYEYLVKAKNIIVPNLRNLEALENVLNIFSRKKDFLDVNLSVKVNGDYRNISEEEKLKLKIDSKLNVKFSSHDLDIRKEVLITNFLKQINSKNLDELTAEAIKSMVQQACDVAKSSDGIKMNIIQGLRYLSTFDLSKIDHKLNNIWIDIQKIYQQQEVKSEFYHLEKASDKHFYMTKVTGKNASFWKEYITQQQNFAKESIDPIAIIRKVSEGINAFPEMLNYHDQDLTDVWVAFFANQTCLNINELNLKSIEMAVTVNTSKNAIFISPVGIARNLTYNGIEHKNLSSELFSCIGEVTQGHYNERCDSTPKLKFINQPVELMQEILIKNFGDNSSFFVGDNLDIEASDSKSLEQLKQEQENLKQHTRSKTNTYSFHENIVGIQISKQKEKIKEGEIYCPILIKGDSKLDHNTENNSFNYVILNEHGEELQSINADQAQGEYAWYFETSYLYKARCYNASTTSADLADLVKGFPQNNPIEYWLQVEPIGDGPIYQG